jgi:hypothetical protein
LSLLNDIIPDLHWHQSSSCKNAEQPMSLERARVLDAALSVRSGLFWIFILSCYASLGKLGNDFLPVEPSMLNLLVILGIVAWLVFGLIDYGRIVACKSALEKAPAQHKARHILEDAAIPLLCFMFVAWVIVFGPLLHTLGEIAPNTKPHLNSINAIILSAPWLAITAAMVTTGAFFRYQEATTKGGYLRYDPT